MKALLLAIKEHLQNDSNLTYVNDNSIFITEDENWLPLSASFPAISIKDGPRKNKQELSKRYIQVGQVKISAFVRMLKSEQGIIGDYGILDLAEDIISSLIGNRLSQEVNGLMNAFPVVEEESIIFEGEKDMIQKETIIFEYTWNRQWT